MHIHIWFKFSFTYFHIWPYKKEKGRSVVGNIRQIAFLKKIFFIYLFSERGEGRKKERKRNIDQPPLARPQLGTGPKTEACGLTRI